MEVELMKLMINTNRSTFRKLLTLGILLAAFTLWGLKSKGSHSCATDMVLTPYHYSYNLICRSPSSPPPAPCRDPSGCSSCRGGGGRRGPGRSGSRSCRFSSCVLPLSWSRPARGSRCTGSRPSLTRARHSHCRLCRPWRAPSSPSAGSDFETLGWYWS